MGERIQDLSVFSLKGQQVTIELNKRDLENLEYDIHIESPPFRYNMTDYQFMQIVASIAEAKRKLEYKQKGQ